MTVPERKQTDRLRKLYKYFKAGRGEISFAISLYQLFLLFQLSGVNAYLRIVMAGSIISLLGVSIGWVSIKYLDTTSPYVMPYTQSYIRKDVLELMGLIEMNHALFENGTIGIKGYEAANIKFTQALDIRVQWLDEPIND